MSDQQKLIVIPLAWISLFFAIVVPIALHIGKQQRKQQSQEYQKSLALYNRGDYAGAEQAIRTRIHMGGGGSFAPLFYQLGRCLLQEGRINDALQEFQKAADEGKGHHSGEGKWNEWIPPDPVIEHKAQAALAWMQQNPNWQPPPPGQTPSSPGPPQDFPAK
jgi:hypothetical protein